ncbi:acyl transferase/acyl hydrolase/lysophospholipase [Phaeosphaeriaceae sp. PMI808]|nr:acyl transferase/acyl hydrolase/lysophospholipase [Phaeosphaeriaceae sp. PMI808]
MSWAQVDFSLVRYSPIEGTHFFYDQRYPSSIQFLLSGRWESWTKAQDPDIRRIAQEAEGRLINDPHSGYTPWPAQPPPGPPTALSNGQPPPLVAQSQPSLASIANLPEDLVLLSPTSNAEKPTASVSPQRAGQPAASALDTGYASPYASQPPPTSYHIHTPQTPDKQDDVSQQHSKPQQSLPQGPPLQPVAPARVVLSRTRETKILLSIDGNGIRGLSALLLVESLVNAICIKIGQRLDPHQIFDLTGGSSLGGVIAILLCRLQMQAHRARDAYKQIARQVFFNKRDFFMSLDPHAPMPTCDRTALQTEIKTIIKQELGAQDARLFDGRTDSGDVFVVSTNIEIGTNKAALMRSYQTRRITGPDLDGNITIAEAMEATSVAPRYMLSQPGATQRLVIQPGLVDHGTAKNNPVRDILYECRKLFRYANDMMIIVSIGTGVGMDRDCEIAEMANAVEDRDVEARAWGEKFEADHQALMERGWMKYFRFNVPGLEDVPLEEWCHEDAVKEKTSEYLVQPEVSEQFYACVEAITTLLLGPQGR